MKTPFSHINRTGHHLPIIHQASTTRHFPGIAERTVQGMGNEFGSSRAGAGTGAE